MGRSRVGSERSTNKIEDARREKHIQMRQKVKKKRRKVKSVGKKERKV